jgi:hypothetical protein
LIDLDPGNISPLSLRYISPGRTATTNVLNKRMNMSTVYGSRIVAVVTLQSLSPYSQSRAHDEPAYENESKGDCDRRTWVSHLHVENGTVRMTGESDHRMYGRGRAV